jgi:hypothetical protein
MRTLDDITGAIVDASLRIHRDLGPGSLESVYEAVLARALNQRGFQVERQQAIRFEYEGMVFEEGFRANRPVGLLINFGAAPLREGLHRIVNGLPASASPRLRVNQGARP